MTWFSNNKSNCSRNRYSVLCIRKFTKYSVRGRKMFSWMYIFGHCPNLFGTGHYLWPGERKTFYGKFFHGPLIGWTKKIAAHSASRNNFSMPTLEEVPHQWRKFLGNSRKKYFDAHSGHLNFFPSPVPVNKKKFRSPPLFPPAPPRP